MPAASPYDTRACCGGNCVEDAGELGVAVAVAGEEAERTASGRLESGLSLATPRTSASAIRSLFGPVQGLSSAARTCCSLPRNGEAGLLPFTSAAAAFRFA